MNLKNLLKTIFFAFGFILTLNFTYGQRTITGTVFGDDGETIPGVSVLVKGTTTGTMTDGTGAYSLTVNDDASTLVFSYIGLETQELQITGNVLNCTLKLAETEIDEVLVVAYGTMKKSDKTGAVSNVTADEFNTGVVTDPIQSIQGKVAGVRITKQGGDPNSGFSVKIRGAASFGSGTGPLYVVDGVPGVDPTTIAVEDIESFNVLKDVSSTAIYGAQGANGIIIITTKKGKLNKESQISVNSYVSIDQVAKRLDLLSADEIRQYVTDNSIDFTDGGANTDWQDEIYRRGMSQSHNISASGGNEKSMYYAGFTHTDFEGVIKGTKKQRTLGRINLSQKGLNDKLTVTTSLSGTVEYNDYENYGGWGLNDVLYQAFRRSPTDSVFHADGTYLESDRMFNSKNPLATINQIQNEREAKRFNGNLKFDLEIIKGLVLGGNFAYTRDDQESFNFTPTYSYKSEGSAGRSYNNYSAKLAETTLKYTNQFADKNNLDLIAGYSYNEKMWDGFWAGGSKPASDYVMSNNLELLQVVNPGDIGSYKGASKLISVFGRGVYNYDEKYYATITLRRDGSTKFGDNKKWGFFPSLALAWNIKSENFLRNIGFISNMKLRAGYGIAGNENIGSYNAVTIMKSSGTSVNPETGETVISFEGDKNPNPDLQWEENIEYNIGLDFGFINNRISGSVEYYNKTLDKLLYQYDVPVGVYKYPKIWANEGKIQNSGIELDIHAFAVDRKNIDWHTSLTFSKMYMNVISLGDEEKYDIDHIWGASVNGPGLVGGETNTQIVEPGKPLGTFYLYKDAGLSPSGEFWFETAAGGVTRTPAEDDKFYMGNALPDFDMGWSNRLNFFKNYELSFTFRAVIGSDIYNGTNTIFGNATGLLPNGNVLSSALDEEARGLSDNATVSSYYIEDGSFLRLDNITLAYNFNTKTIKYLKELKIYVTSNNLWLLTNYTGIDPEMSYDGLFFGVENFNIYPKTRTFTFGINATF
jgi:iron complex outermembrane receptor protein